MAKNAPASAGTLTCHVCKCDFVPAPENYPAAIYADGVPARAAICSGCDDMHEFYGIGAYAE